MSFVTPSPSAPKSLTDTDSEGKGIKTTEEEDIQEGLEVDHKSEVDTWTADEDEGFQDTEGTPTSEDIDGSDEYIVDLDEGDEVGDLGYSRGTLDNMIGQLRGQGWTESRIANWMQADQDLNKAMSRLEIGGAGEDDVSDVPSKKIMFDGGTFDHNHDWHRCCRERHGNQQEEGGASTLPDSQGIHVARGQGRCYT